MILNFSIIIILGLLIGSFLNVCIYRIPRGESINFPPSHCTNCNNRIKWYDLIPVISYLFLKGKCRYCGEKISFRYPLIELITGALFGALYIEYGLSFNLVKFAFLVSLLIVLAMIDFDTTDVYLSTTLTGIISGCLFLFYSLYTGQGFLTYIYGAALGGGIIAIIILLTGGMGWGDFEICLLCGLFLGFKLTIPMLFFSFVFGGIIGILLVITKRKSRKDYIPFGPYIAIGCIFVILFGEKIINMYLSLLM